MKKRLLALFLLPVLLAPLARAVEDNDFQTWLDASVAKAINDRWTVRLEQELWMADDSSRTIYTHTDLGAAWKANDHLICGLYYRSVESRSGEDWKHEDRPHLDFVFKGAHAGVQAQNRARFEYRIRNNVDEVMRFRDRVMVLYPTTLLGAKVTPYISEEAFIDTDQGDFNQFRTATGLKKKFGTSFEGDLYYLWQAVEASTDWTDAHILGLAGSFLF